MLFEKLNYSVAGHNSFSCCWLKFFPFSYSFHLLTFLPPKAGHIFWCLDTRVNFLMTRPYNAQHEICWNPLECSTPYCSAECSQLHYFFCPSSFLLRGVFFIFCLLSQFWHLKYRPWWRIHNNILGSKQWSITFRIFFIFLYDLGKSQLKVQVAGKK